MSLQGSLDAFSLPDIFQLLSFSQKTGALHLRAESTGIVFFHSGEVYFASSRQGDTLGSALVRSGVVGEDEWKRAVADAKKGVSVGDAFDIAGRPGSQAHDEIFWSEERGYYRETNRAGGVEGGMTTGDPVIVRGAMKPLPTLTKPLRSVDIATKEPAQALRERTDSCTVPAAGVVGEAMVAFVLAQAAREKFGGDHIDDALAAAAAYRERIGWKR